MYEPEPGTPPQDNTQNGDGATVRLRAGTLDTLRAELRRRWQADDPIPAEVLFPPDADRSLKLQLVFTELLLREETGRRATVDDFRARLPDLADDISRQLDLLGMLASAGASGATLPTFAAAPDAAAVCVPGYEVERPLGRGGMGVVYLARQVRCNRWVALKVLLAGSHASAEDVRRFQNEAEAIARLNHPGIVQVFDTGEWTAPGGGPLPYFSMEYCPGGSLAARLKGDPQTPAAAARIARDLARAAEAAHRAGVVHRDLKPANVLMHGDTPKVTDFGLAKKLDADDGQTRSGSILGTPSYMPPEQAAGKTRELGPLVDVYALGAVLYEMLVGRPPFKGASLLETLDQVQHREPVAPRQLRPSVPRDLETVALRCLQKDPKKRYASAADLAADLDRFLEGRPIKARPVGAAERGWRWASRNRALAGLFAVSTLAAVAVVGLGLWFSHRLGSADAQKKAAEELARAQRSSELLTRVRSRSARPKPGWTWDSLKDIQEAAALADTPQRLAALRSEAAACLAALDVRPAGTLLPEQQFTAAAWHPDGTRVALGERGNVLLPFYCNVYLADPRKPDTVRALVVPARNVFNSAGNIAPDIVFHLAFSPDGRWLAAGMRSGFVHVLDLANPKRPAVSAQVGTQEVYSLAFGSDGRRCFAVCGKVVASIDPETGQVKDRRDGGRYPVVAAPDGGGLLYVGPERRSADARLRETRPMLKAAGDAWGWLADGRLLSVTGHRARVTDGQDGAGFDLIAPGHDTTHEGRPLALAPRRGASLLTLSDGDRRARLWDPCDGRMMAELVAGGPEKAAFCPFGRGFVVLEEKGARLYEVRERREAGAVGLQAGAVTAFALHDGGRTLVTAAPAGVTDHADYGLYDADRGTPLARFRLAHEDPGSRDLHLLLSGPDHRLTRAGRLSGPTRLLSAEGLTASGGAATPLAGRTVHGLAAAGDRTWAVVDDTLVSWGPAGPGPTWRNVLGEAMTGKPSLYAVAAAAGRVAVASRDGHLRSFDDGGKELRPKHAVPTGDVPLRSVAVSADGRQALAGTERGELVLFDLDRGAIVARRQGHEDWVTGCAFGPGGVVVSASEDKFIRVWRAESGELHEVAALPHDREVRRLVLSPDGVTLYALLAREHGVRVWHLDRLFERFASLGLGDGLPALAARPLKAAPFAVPALPPTPSGPGLRCELYRVPDFLGPFKARVDPAIDFTTAAGPLEPGLPPHQYSARWSGWLKAPKPGRYTIRLSGAAALRLWLDGERRIDLWPSAAGGGWSFEADLKEGPHELRVEVSVASGVSTPKLTWSKAGGFRERVIGPGALFTDLAAVK